MTYDDEGENDNTEDGLKAHGTVAMRPYLRKK